MSCVARLTAGLARRRWRRSRRGSTGADPADAEAVARRLRPRLPRQARRGDPDLGLRQATATPRPPGPPPPPRRLEGAVVSRYVPPSLAVHPTPEDATDRSTAATTSTSTSLPDRALPRPPRRSAALPRTATSPVAARRPAACTSSASSRPLPSFAWPEAGDRVAIDRLLGLGLRPLGRRGERTEIHSYRALWVERTGRPSGARGKRATCSLASDKTYRRRRGRTARTSWRRAPSRSSSSLPARPSQRGRDMPAASYRFACGCPAAAPARGCACAWSDAGSTPGAMRARRDCSAAARRRGQARRQADAGPALVIASSACSLADPRREHRVRGVTFSAHARPACDGPWLSRRRSRPAARTETTHGEQVSTPPGEWNVYVDAAGVWGRGATACCGRATARSSATARRSTSGLRAARPWRVLVFTRECDFGSLGNADGATPRHDARARARPGVRHFATATACPGLAIVRFASAAGCTRLPPRPPAAARTCPAGQARLLRARLCRRVVSAGPRNG